MSVAPEVTMIMKGVLGGGIIFLLVACNRAEVPAETTITIAGSTALMPLVQEAGRRYMKDHPEILIQVAAGGSHVGLQKAEAGEVTLGASDIFAEKGSHLVDHRVAVVGLAAMAHQGTYDAAIDSLTKEEIRDIFTGKIRNWSELGGDDQAITVINREKSSGTFLTSGRFQREVLPGLGFIAIHDMRVVRDPSG